MEADKRKSTKENRIRSPHIAEERGTLGVTRPRPIERKCEVFDIYEYL